MEGFFSGFISHTGWLLPQTGFVHSGNDCIECTESTGWNWFFLVVMLTVVIIAVVVLVKRATSASTQTDWRSLTKQEQRARLLVPTMKVTISYLQVL